LANVWLCFDFNVNVHPTPKNLLLLPSSAPTGTLYPRGGWWEVGGEKLTMGVRIISFGPWLRLVPRPNDKQTNKVALKA